MDEGRTRAMSSQHLGCNHVPETGMDSRTSWHRHVLSHRHFSKRCHYGICFVHVSYLHEWRSPRRYLLLAIFLFSPSSFDFKNDLLVNGKFS